MHIGLTSGTIGETFLKEQLLALPVNVKMMSVVFGPLLASYLVLSNNEFSKMTISFVSGNCLTAEERKEQGDGVKLHCSTSSKGSEEGCCLI